MVSNGMELWNENQTRHLRHSNGQRLVWRLGMSFERTTARPIITMVVAKVRYDSYDRVKYVTITRLSFFPVCGCVCLSVCELHGHATACSSNTVRTYRGLAVSVDLRYMYIV